MRRSTLVETLLAVAAAVAVALVLQAYVAKPYRIPSPSMAPTLEPGDRVLVDRLTPRFRDIHRGDVIVFRYPVDEDYVFVKRVVGLPGETLSLRDGRVCVDGRALDEPYLHRTKGAADVTYPAAPIAGTTMRRPWSLAQPYRVPAGSYFVMGDNRTESDDSRSWGAVKAGEVIGIARLIYWPVGRWRGL